MMTEIKVEGLMRSEDRQYTEENLRSLGQFAGKFSHDLGNVLEVIHSNLEFVLSATEQKNLSEEQIACLRDALDACASGAAVSHQLLGYARKQSYDAEELSLRELILDVVNLCSYSFQGGYEFILDEALAEKDVLVYGGYSDLGYSLLTVFKDAREAMPVGGRILVRVDTDKNYAHLFVTDETGRLIDQKCGESGDNTLGNVSLDVVRGVLERQGGGLALQSEGEFGASVVLSIPLARSYRKQQQQEGELEHNESHSEAVDGKAATPKRHFLRKTQAIHFEEYRDKEPLSNDLERMSVMVLDDDLLVNRGIGRLMSRVGFGAVNSLTNPVEALEGVLSGFLPDWVFVDYSMPEMNGLEFVEQMLEFQNRQRFVEGWEPRFVLMSAYPPDQLEKLVGKASLEKLQVLTKPFTMETIRNIVRPQPELVQEKTSVIRLSDTCRSQGKTTCFFGSFGPSTR